MGKPTDTSSGPDLAGHILSALRGRGIKKDESDSKRTKNSLKVKTLRRQVLLSTQQDESDKVAKKLFKDAVTRLEEEGALSLDAEGIVTLLEDKKKKKKKRKEEKKVESEKKAKKAKKKKRESPDDDDDDGAVAGKESKKHKSDEGEAERNENEDKISRPQSEDGVAEDEESAGEAANPTASSKDKKPCKNNPAGITRLFLGNLPFAVDEQTLASHLSSAGEITHLRWITDKETGRFYGSAFVEMATANGAGKAVEMTGTELMGRPVKINFSPAREGDVWPPKKRVVSGSGRGGGGKSGQAGGRGVKAMSPKPENCMKLFIGNLSYDIDDDGIVKFFGSVDAEVKAVRWIHHRDTGDFKGVGFVEFWNTEACEKGASLNGKNLLGRPIRIDWTD